MLDKFTPQGFTLKQNPFYWDKSKVHVPSVDFPSYTSNANLVPPVASGQIDWAGNQIAGIKANYLDKSPDNHTWMDQRAVPVRQQRGGPVVQRDQGTAERPGGPAGDQLRHQPAAAVRRGRDRLRAAGHLIQRPAAPDRPELPHLVAGERPAAAGDAAKVTSRPDRRRLRRRSTASGPRTASRSASRSRTRSPTATTTPTRSSSRTSSNALGFNVTVKGDQATRPCGTPTSPTAPSTPTIHWSNQGPNPYFYLRQLAGQHADRAHRQARRGRLRPLLQPAGAGRPGPVRRHQRLRHPGAGHQQAAADRVHPGAGRPAAVRRGLGRVLDQELHRLADPRATPTWTRYRTRRTWSTPSFTSSRSPDTGGRKDDIVIMTTHLEWRSRPAGYPGRAGLPARRDARRSR